ncbi:UNVERIFIED_CONTAM: hypothetical protein FKN15_028782 [Acipenser sinensis]
MNPMEALSTDKSVEDEDSVDGNRPSSASSSSSKAPPSGKKGASMGMARRPSSAAGPKTAGKEASAGAIDEEDFIRAFDDVPPVQIYSNRELEDSMNKIREILSDDKHDWEQRVVALKKVRSLLLAGAVEYDGYLQQLRLLEAAFKLSAKDLRSQVVREACITLGHLSTVLGNRFDHGAESIMPTLLNLVPNSAKIMATSGIAAINLIIRHTHYPRLIPIMTSNCTSKSVAVRRRCYTFLDLLLQEWQTHSLERHLPVLTETIKKGVHDADSEARSVARKCYWGFHGHFSREAELLFHNLESSYQKALQSHLKNSDSIISLPQSDRSSSSSQESLNRPLSTKRPPAGSSMSRALRRPNPQCAVHCDLAAGQCSEHTHYPRLIPIMTSNCTSKSVAVRRRCYTFLDLLLQEWQTHSLERCYWGFHGHFSREAELLFHNLESSYQKALQSHLKNSDSIISLPQSDRSSSSSQESLNRPLTMKRPPAGSSVSRASVVSSKSVSTPGSLQRSRSDVDVNAAASAKSRMTAAPSATPFSTAAALPPGSYASLGRVRTRRQSSDSAAGGSTTPADNRGRTRAKVSQSQPGSRSGSPGKLLGQSYRRAQRGALVSTPSEKRSKIPRSQGCSRETSPNRLGLGEDTELARVCVLGPSGSPHCQARSSRIPRPSMSQGCSRDTSRESSRDTSPARGFTALASRRHSRSTSALSIAESVGQPDRFGLSHQARISASVNAMRVLSASTEVEAAVADALRKPVRRRFDPPGMYSDDDANSDASSACSERSYGSRNGGVPHYLRQTEDVAEVLNHCASSNWSERKEGLVGLQNLLKSQRTLSRVELKRLCEIFTRMFADPHSKVFSMFLETLVDFITIHKEDLQDWLFVLLTQLLKKMGADLLGSVQAKVQKALDVTRDSFPFDQQFNILMRFIVDQTQTPNLKVKVAILKYIESLARQMDPTDFVNSSETRLAVSRIITWTTEPKSSDVRKAAQVVLISLFELNTPEFTMLLGALPKTFQDGATKLLHSHLKNSSNTSVGSPSNTIGRTPSRHSSSRTSPLTSPTNCSHGGLSPSMLDYDTENMNSDEIYSSLRGVTEAIQSFSYQSQEDLHEPIKREGKKDDGVCREGGMVTQVTDLRVGIDAVEGGRTALDNKTSLLNTPPPCSFSGPRSREHNPYNYADTISTYDKSALNEAIFDGEMEQGMYWHSFALPSALHNLSTTSFTSVTLQGF